MSHLAAICSALDFVEQHLTESITVADMAAAASYSLYHFSRTFNRIVHHTPYDYLMRRRLSESSRQLFETDRRIIDIALDYQFNNPETYSRAFKRMFGIQPSQWRAHGGPHVGPILPHLTRDYLEHINQGDYLKPVLKGLDALRLVGVMTLIRDDPETIPELWSTLKSELARVEGVRNGTEAYGLTWYAGRPPGRGVLYMAAAAPALLDLTGSALIVKTLPALKCARFIHKGSREDLHHSQSYIHRTWLPRSGERVAHPLEIEYYGNDWDAPGNGGKASQWALYIPIV